MLLLLTWSFSRYVFIGASSSVYHGLAIFFRLDTAIAHRLLSRLNRVARLLFIPSDTVD